MPCPGAQGKMCLSFKILRQMLLGKPLQPEGGKTTLWVCQLGQDAKPCFWRTCSLSTLTSASHCRNVGLRNGDGGWFGHPALSATSSSLSLHQALLWFLQCLIGFQSFKIVDSDHFINLLFVLVEGLTSRASYFTVFCNVTAFIFVELFKSLIVSHLKFHNRYLKS